MNGSTQNWDCARLRAVAGLTAALTILMALIMLAGMVGYPAREKFHDNIQSPVLALELARNKDDLQQVFQTADPKDAPGEVNGADALNAYRAVSALKGDTIEDCGFIPLYSSFLFAIIVLFSSDSVKKRLRIGPGLLIVAVAALDYAENLGIFRAIAAPAVTDHLAHAIRYPSLAKWALLGVALVVLGGLMMISKVDVFPKGMRKLLGAAFILTGVMLAGGTACPVWIGYANQVFALLVIVSAIGLLWPFFARKWPN